MLTPLLAQAQALCELADRAKTLAASMTEPADQVRLVRYEKELREQAELLVATARGEAEPALLLADPISLAA